MIVRLGLVALFGISLLFSAQSYAAVIKDIRMWHAPDHTRIVLDMDQRSRFNVFTLENPGRVVVDLDNALLNARIPGPGTIGQFINKIRLGSPRKR